MTIQAPTDQTLALTLEGGATAAIASVRRATLAERYAADAFVVEWRDFAQLAAIAGEWRELAANVLEPNAFYEPAFALAAAPVFGRGAGAVLVWSASAPRRLLGFFPARIDDAALRRQIAGVARLDPRLCPAWGAAGRARSRRSGHCRMAGASRRGREAAGRAAAAVPSARRSVRRDPGNNPAAHADAERRFQSPPTGVAGAGQRARALCRTGAGSAPA